MKFMNRNLSRIAKLLLASQLIILGLQFSPVKSETFAGWGNNLLELAKRRQEADLEINASIIQSITILTEGDENNGHHEIKVDSLFKVKPLNTIKNKRNVMLQNEMFVHALDDRLAAWIGVCQSELPVAMQQEALRKPKSQHWCYHWVGKQAGRPADLKWIGADVPEQGTQARLWLNPDTRYTYGMISKSDIMSLVDSGPTGLPSIEDRSNIRQRYRYLLAGYIRREDSDSSYVDRVSYFEVLGIRVHTNSGWRGPDSSTELAEPLRFCNPLTDANSRQGCAPRTDNPIRRSVHSAYSVGQRVYVSCTSATLKPRTCNLDSYNWEPAISIDRPIWWPL
jgi:hypothetical protein